MITAKQLYNTYPHRQMRGYIEQEYPQLTRMERGQKLAALTRKFLRNCGELEEVPRNIADAFAWRATPEGHDFWGDINNVILRPDPVDLHLIAPVARMVKAKPAPVVAKKKVGWW